MQRRRLSTRAALALDVAVAAATGAFGVWREARQPADLDRLVPLPIGVRIALQVVAAVLLLGRRQFPLHVGVAISALSLATPVQPPVVIAYSIAAHAEQRRAAAWAIVAVIASWGVGAQIWQLADKLSGPIALAFAIVLGLYVRARRGLYDALVDRAERAEREQHLLAEQAVGRERSRLAGEMHDVLSHRLSLMLLDAGALSVTTTDPQARAAIERLRAHGVAALDDLRGIFGQMALDPSQGDDESRSSSHSSTPPVAELVAQWHAAGGRVELAVDGDGELDPVIERTAYRIVQEGLTNAAKHSPGAAVEITVRHRRSGVDIEVSNAAAQTGSTEEPAGRGSGLAGLRQRVALVGGTLSAEPLSDRGFRLAAQLPSAVPTTKLDVPE